ncbi:hypothetical protein AS189_09400 [Arthrobacter alpinus]|uniref:Uncharacterized protein n=1 Tax=Arthrobacter alpinus TaxID=656366 RepID=A0A0S2LYX6_9MICC|nr:hypothetical protein [Arthrobacter alpinus]ALO66669.1 hypothetical protein AS189_09400 [Arthrobacter alpinus]
MMTEYKKPRGLLAYMTPGLLAFIVGSVVVIVFSFFAWFFSDAQVHYRNADRDRPNSAPKQPLEPVEEIEYTTPPRQGLRSLEEIERKTLARESLQHVEENYEPSDQEIEEANRESWEKVFGKGWSCLYAPTMNENWHDDVSCTDGVNAHRPNLLADWGFVTEDDMRAAAQEYESYLNSGGTP